MYDGQITHLIAWEMWPETVCGPEYNVEICWDYIFEHIMTECTFIKMVLKGLMYDAYFPLKAFIVTERLARVMH
jgi:hypothetical protein